MFDELDFPRKPDNDLQFDIDKEAKDILRAKLLLGLKNETAFALYRRDLCDVNGKLTKTGRIFSSQFFTHPKNEKWYEAYRETVLRFIRGEKKATKKAQSAEEIGEERIDNAFNSFLMQAIKDIEDGKEFDNDTFKLFMELFKKLGRFKDDIVQEEAPRRYLPELCSQCLYKACIDTHTAKGEIENTCLRCKALKLAQTHGFIYDPTRLLELKSSSNNEV